MVRVAGRPGLTAARGGEAADPDVRQRDRQALQVIGNCPASGWMRLFRPLAMLIEIHASDEQRARAHLLNCVERHGEVAARSRASLSTLTVEWIYQWPNRYSSSASH